MIESEYLNDYGLFEYKINIGHMVYAGQSNLKLIDPSAPLVIFLHGYLDNSNSFLKLLKVVEKNSSNYQYLAIDHAGHGNSSHRSQDAHYHLVDYCYDLQQLVDFLTLKQFVLIGHSLGGIVSNVYASTQPKNLIGLIAIESCGPLAENESTTSKQISNCFTSRKKALQPIKQPGSFEQVVKARLSVSDLCADDARDIMHRNVQIESNGKCKWKTDKRLRTKSALRMTEGQSMNILDNIACKRAVILGDRGFEKVKKGIFERRTIFENIDLYTFSGGHYVHLDSPLETARTIIDTLNKWVLQ